MFPYINVKNNCGMDFEWLLDYLQNRQREKELYKKYILSGPIAPVLYVNTPLQHNQKPKSIGKPHKKRYSRPPKSKNRILQV